MGASQNIRKIVKAYLDDVEATITKLDELTALADMFDAMVRENERIDLEVEEANRKIGCLQGVRTDLYQAFHAATFDGDEAKVAEVEQERDNLDERMATLQQGIEDSLSGLQSIDGDAVAEMVRRADEARAPLLSSDRVLHFVHNPSRLGLLDQLEVEHNRVVGEISRRKKYIRELQPWYRFARESVPA